MYNLPYFKENEKGVVLDFIRQHPFALLTGCDAQHCPVATQVPVLVEEREGKLFLTGHLMRNTDHHKAFQQNAQVLCVFTGAHSYVSATWYTNPQQASTWNYQSVHARGLLRFLDEQALIDILQKTSVYFEGGNQQSTTVYENLPADYTAKLLHAIVAFEVEVTALDNVFKLSQNRDKESYVRIIEHLSSQEGEAKAVAEAMKERAAQLFKED